jgi:uncharacterized protein YciI
MKKLFVVNLTYQKPIEEIDRFLNAHRDFLNKHIESKQILLAGRKNPRVGGVILILEESLDVAQKIMEQDPFISENLATIDILEVDVTLFQPNLIESYFV